MIQVGYASEAEVWLQTNQILVARDELTLTAIFLLALP